MIISMKQLHLLMYQHSLKQKNLFSKVYDVVDENYTIVDSVRYHVYLNELNVEKLLSAYSYTSEPYDKIIRLSDYNHLLKIKGKNQVTLNNDEYILVYDRSDSFLAEDSSIKTITLSNGITLNQKSTTTELSFSGLTNAGYAVVVPDDAIHGLEFTNILWLLIQKKIHQLN